MPELNNIEVFDLSTQKGCVCAVNGKCIELTNEEAANLGSQLMNRERRVNAIPDSRWNPADVPNEPEVD